MTIDFKALGLTAFEFSPLDRLGLDGVAGLGSTLDSSMLQTLNALDEPMTNVLKMLDSPVFRLVDDPVFAAMGRLRAPLSHSIDALNPTLAMVMKGLDLLPRPDSLSKLGIGDRLFDPGLYPPGLPDLIAGITPFFDPDLFREAHAKTTKTATELGRRGWTMPMHMTPSEMVEVVENCADAAETDAAMVAWATGSDSDDARRRIDIIADSLLDERAGYGFWMSSLAPAVRTALTDQFRSVIPTLLMVLEGKIAEATGATGSNVKSPTKAHLAGLEDDRLEYAVWASVAAFLGEYLYKGYDFANDDPPPRVDRHGAMHGRQSPDLWTEADAIRLLIALDTVADCIVPWDDDDLEELDDGDPDEAASTTA